MAKRRSNLHDKTTLQMALIGYEMEKKRIEEKIGEIQGRLGVAKAGGTQRAEEPKRRTMSAAARRRIGIAQRRRWAEQRKEQARRA
jgi:hypothetical protein